MKIDKKIVPCNFFFLNMFAVGGEPQAEILRYNTRVPPCLKKSEKFTNWMENNIVCPEITNNVPSFVLGQKITIFDSP